MRMLFPAPLAKITVICYNVVKRTERKAFLRGFGGYACRALRRGRPVAARNGRHVDLSVRGKDSSRRTQAAICYRGNMVLIALIGKQYPQVPETSVYSACNALFAYAERPRKVRLFFGTLVSLA